jgi:hypothetical protein
MSGRRASTPAEWRAAQAIKRRGKAVPLLLPSGGTVMIVRPPIETWFGTRKLPESLAAVVVSVFSTERAEDMNQKIEALTEQDNAQLVKFMNRLLMEGVAEPIIVDKEWDELAEGEMALADIDEEDRGHIMYHIMEGVPLQAVETRGGEIELDALDSFREGSDSSGDGPTSGEVLIPPVAADGNP